MNRARILVIEDSREDQIFISRSLSSLGVPIRVAGDAKGAWTHLAKEKISLIIMDVNLPGQDGFQLFSEIQAQPEYRQIPVIFLTGQADITKKIAAFSMGADDYVVKPFNPLEFKARIEAKLRRIVAQNDSIRSLQKGPMKLDSATQRVTLSAEGQETRVHLTPREFKLLFHLARNEDQILSRTQLLDAVWGDSAEVFDRTVDAHVSAIRKKLGEYSNCIESVPGEGYRFSSPSNALAKRYSKAS